MATEATTSAGSQGAPTKSIEQLAELSKRVLEESFNEGNYEALDQYVAPDAPFHDPATPARMASARGPGMFKEITQMYRAAFPDVHMVVDDVVAASDKVVARWHCEGTHQGELEGMAPTGAHVMVTGISIDLWKDEKIVETWVEWDNLGLARQIGAAPAEGSVGEKVGLWVQRMTARRMARRSSG